MVMRPSHTSLLSLDNAEEHLFSRRRRRLALDPFGDAHKEESYALFARGSGSDAAVPSSVTGNSAEEGVEKLLVKVGIVDAMSSAKDENVAEASMAADLNDDDSDDDGWAAEDNSGMK